MTREDFFEYCRKKYGTLPDYPFDDLHETAVFRHNSNNKWYAIVMKVRKSKFSFEDDTVKDVVNLKLPLELSTSFGRDDGVFPAYHMNKRHWISVILDFAEDDTVKFLLNVSFEATKGGKINFRKC